LTLTVDIIDRAM